MRIVTKTIYIVPANREPNFQRPRTEAGAHLWPWPRWFLCSQIFLLTPLTLDQPFAQVHVCNVVVLDNPSHFKNPFQFEITFECIEVRFSKSTKCFYLWWLDQDLPEDLEWKIIYVGSAESEEYDQVIQINNHRFTTSLIWRHLILCMSGLCQREDTCSSSRYSQQLLTFWCRLHKSFTLVMAKQKISWILDAQADPPNPDKIPEADLVGVTVVLLTCSYRSAGQSSLYSTVELWTDSV